MSIYCIVYFSIVISYQPRMFPYRYNPDNGTSTMSQSSSTIPPVPGTQMTATSTMSQSSSAMLPLPGTNSPGKETWKRKVVLVIAEA